MSFPEYSTDEDAIFAIWEICVHNFSVQSRIRPTQLARDIEAKLAEYVGGEDALMRLVRERLKTQPTDTERLC